MYLDDCVCVLSGLAWLPLLGVGRKSWYIILTIRLVMPPKITGGDLNEHEWECDWVFWGSSSLLSSPTSSSGRIGDLVVVVLIVVPKLLLHPFCLPPVSYALNECCMKGIWPAFCWKWTYRFVVRATTTTNITQSNCDSCIVYYSKYLWQLHCLLVKITVTVA